jgi:hypothetical protein
MPLFIIISTILFLIIISGKIPEPVCMMCKDTGTVEVLVMGTDTDYVPCDCQETLKTKRKQTLNKILN